VATQRWNSLRIRFAVSTEYRVTDGKNEQDWRSGYSTTKKHPRSDFGKNSFEQWCSGKFLFGGASPSPLPSLLSPPLSASCFLPSLLYPLFLSRPSPPGVQGSPPLPSHPLFFPPFPSLFSLSFPLEVGPLLRLKGLGERLSSPIRSGWSPAAKRFLVNCRLNVARVVAMVLMSFTKDTSTWSIARKRNTLRCTSITIYHLLCNGTQKFQCCYG